MIESFKRRLEELIANESNFISNAANFSALIFYNFKDINWAGFYLLNDGELILGPFQGKVACIRITLGDGVCGSAARQRKSLVVDDVHSFPGHIACDPSSNSELVIPLISNGKLYGVLDLDSPIHNRFNQSDREIFEDLAKILIEQSDMEMLESYYNITDDIMESATY